MSDGTLQRSNDNIATDELATLNGTDVSGTNPKLKVQRVKLGYGSDASLQDVDDAHPLPISGVVESSTATPKGIFTMTLAGAAVALPSVVGGIPNGSKFIDFVPSVDVRYTDDGTTIPDADTGIPVAAGQAWRIAVVDLADVQFFGPAGQIDGGFYA